MIQLETRLDDPYSVNLGCIDAMDSLYVGAPDPEDSRWVANLLEDPRVRLRIGETLYELQAVRVTDPGEFTFVERRLHRKYDYQPPRIQAPGWLFRLDPV